MKTQSSVVLKPKCYFYTNAIYMGMTKSMSRIGTGIILYHHDNCAIVSYNTNSQLNGHCIFYRSRCLISARYDRNKLISIAYRIDGFLLFLKYNDSSKIHGNCFLVSILQQTVHQIKYEDGEVKSKTKIKVLDGNPIEDLFIYNAYHLILGPQHGRAITHEITNNDIKNIRMKKIGNNVQVFYGERQIKKVEKEIGFSFIYRIPEAGGYDMEKNRYRDDFELYFVEKGQYKFNKLEGYGQRIFKNNNQYEGYFKENLFNGEGALKNSSKGNWVYGIFQKGEMIEVLDFSNGKEEEVKYQIILQNLRRNEVCLVNETIEQHNFSFLDTELEKVYLKCNMQQQKIVTFQERKLQIMKKIASKFTDNELQQESEQNSKPLGTEILPKQKTPDKKQVKHTIRSLLSKSVQMKKNSDTNVQQFDKNQLLSIGNSKNIKSLENQEGTNISKIFKKNYQHLSNQLLSDKKKEINEIIKLHKIKGKKRNHSIFDIKINQKNPISQFSLNLNQSPQLFSESRKGRRLLSSTPYKRRSPYRKTTIFQTTIKVKKVNKNLVDEQKNDSDESVSIQKLESIRKGQTQRKNKTKSRLKKTQKIFEEQKEKESSTHGKFVYLYENTDEPGKSQKKSQQDSNLSQSLILKARRYLMPKTS